MKHEKITPFLWFDHGKALPAAKFYVSIFPRSKITNVSSLTVTFTLDGRPYVALNGGPYFTLNPAFSLFVRCETQAEVNRLWKKLTSGGGEESRCGWLVDKFGLSWQIVPKRLLELLSHKDPAIASKAQASMMTMRKIDIATLERAVK
jgi:predicted 3-demethylubiquinone-9 3-methyltransferase (glyoxalase superfamily)